MDIKGKLRYLIPIHFYSQIETLEYIWHELITDGMIPGRDACSMLSLGNRIDNADVATERYVTSINSMLLVHGGCDPEFNYLQDTWLFNLGVPFCFCLLKE